MNCSLQSLYTVSPKTRHHSRVHNFSKCLPIFKILSLSDSAVNLQWSDIYKFLLALILSLHYLVKYQCSKNRHAQWVSAAECRVRLRHSKKTISKYLSHEIISIWIPSRKMFTSAVLNITTHCTQLLQRRKRCRRKMPYVISSRSVADGVSLSVSASILVYRIFDICW